MTGIEKTVTAAGGLSALARHLGVSRQRVQGWSRQGFVPHKWVRKIEAEFGVPRRELLAPHLRDLLEDAGE